MNKEGFNNQMLNIMNKELKESYNQGIADTALSLQKSLESLDDNCKNETTYQLVLKLLNNIVSEKVYGNDIKEVK